MHTSLKETNAKEYEKWKLKHNYSLNYQGSSPNMESSGAVSIFSQSIKERGLRYLNYYGDGDSKSFQNIENIYEGVTITKYECRSHYQKRVGNRLRKLKQRVKGLGGKEKTKKYEVQKVNGGKVQKLPPMRLTDVLIDKLQNCFGIAFLSNASA